jgi:predicted SnoaL-like aldol condensation-catalyzing enzyme
MRTKAALNLVESLTQDIWNGANYGAEKSLFSENFVDHDPIFGQGAGGAGFVEMVKMLRLVTPNLLISNDAVYIDETQNVVTIRWRATGISRGSLFDVFFGKKEFVHKGIDIYRIENKQFVEHWGEIDILPS